MDLKAEVEHQELSSDKSSGSEKVVLPSDGPIIELGGDAERKLLRKMDFHIIPFVMLCYTLSFLDRVNIGNARLYKLEADLGLKGNQYQVCVSLLFVTYVTFEIPSNVVIKRFHPNRWIAFLCVGWGLVSTFTGLTRNYGEMIFVRLLLGAFEAGLFPGMTIYLTLFYTKREMALRMAYLFGSAALAGATGGLLAFAIGHLQGKAGMNGWRWIFILEGIPCVLTGIVIFFLLPNSTDTAYFLTKEERLMCAARRSREYGQTAKAQKFSRKDSKKTFTDWKVYAFAFAHFGVLNMLYGFSTFLPTIIDGLGKWTTAQVQLLTIPCYFLGGTVYLIVSRISDVTRMRGIFTIGSCCISMIGYGILIADVSQGVHYFATFLVACGLYSSIGLPLTWLSNNYPRFGKRTTGLALQLSIGNCAGVLAPFIYLTTEGPKYVKGHGITLALLGASALFFTALLVWFSRTNKARDSGLHDSRVSGMTEEEIAEMGEESPRYRFTL